jgi:glycosyltransferase involved in cell wall biosynthesis
MELKQYEVSILIPCYNERKNLERLLNALIKQKVSPLFLIREIVVVASVVMMEAKKL